MSQDALSQDELISTFTAAELLKVGQRTIHRWIDAGFIPAHRTFGGHRRILKKDLIEYAGRQGIPVGSADESIPKYRILLVDDDPDYLDITTAILTREFPDIEIMTALNGFAAGAKVVQSPPNLILLDLIMPGLSGVEVCHWIKTNPEPSIQSTRVVAVTSSRNPANHGALRLAGADDTLYKPMDREKLVAVVRKSMSRNGRPRQA